MVVLVDYTTLIQIPFVCSSSTAVPAFSQPNNHQEAPPRNPPSLPMDHAFKFPINLNSGETGPPPPGEDSSSRFKYEMDFFAISRSRSNTYDNDVNTVLNLRLTNTNSTEENGVSSEVRNPVAELQAEVCYLTGENQSLRNMLNEATATYNSLQLQLNAAMKEQNSDHNPDNETNNLGGKKEQVTLVPRQFMDLGIGATEERSLDWNIELEVTSKGDDRNHRIGRDLGKRIRDRSPDQELSIWNNKVSRFGKPAKNVDQDATEATMRKVRVSVRAISEKDNIADGCQWRKYGQKYAKGNPCPRAYYRCTMTNNCLVRKKVQRCAEDKSVLVSSYEGSHNHPLPRAAMAMASTTSAAADSLLSGSISSTNSLMSANLLGTTLLPCSSSIATISASAPFPTITLDMTKIPNSDILLQTATNQLFMNPNQTFTNTSDALVPQIFRQALFNQTRFSGIQTSQDLKGASSENRTDNLTDASAAITADPNFTAALAAVLSSIMAGGAQTNASSSYAPTNTQNGDTKGGNYRKQ